MITNAIINQLPATYLITQNLRTEKKFLLSLLKTPSILRFWISS